MNKNNEELGDLDRATELWTGDYEEPEECMRFYAEKHKLWEMRFGYQEDKNISFEENVKCYIKFNYERGLVKKILDEKTTYFYETGKILCE